MTSPKLTLAAQTNGKKSHGPKTPEGKRRSSRNSFKHGLYGKQIPFDAECDEDFRTLHAAYTAEYQPATSLEASHVLQFALNEARQIWAMRLSADLINKAWDALPPDTEEGLRLAMAFRKALHALDVLDRFEYRFVRQAERAYKLLNRNRAQCGERTVSSCVQSAKPHSNQRSGSEPVTVEVASLRAASPSLPPPTAPPSAEKIAVVNEL